MVDLKDGSTLDMTITDILNNALSGEKVIRQDAESRLGVLAMRNFPEFLYSLAAELADEGKPTKIRQMAATFIKNSITSSSELKEIWLNKIEKVVKDQIKNLILSTLATKFKEVRAAAALVIAGICKVDLPLSEKWPGLIDSLCQSSYHDNINIRLAAIESLGYICEEQTLDSMDSSLVDNILTSLIQNITGLISEAEVVKSSLKAFFHVIKLAKKNFAKENELQIIMSAIFLAGNSYANDESVLEKIALIFIEIISVSEYYDYIAEYLKKIAEFTFYLLKNKGTDEKLAQLAFEFWCSLGDEEVKRFKTEHAHNLNTLSGTGKTSSQISHNKKYLSSFYTSLIEAVLLYINPQDDDDDEGWTLSKASAYILNCLVQVIDSEMMEKILQYIEAGLPSEDTKLKNISLLLFAHCINSTSHKNRIYEFVSRQLNKIVKLLFHESFRIKKSSSYVLTRITKIFSKSGLFEANLLSTLVPMLINAFSSPNRVSINVLQSLINITKGVGDLETVKNSNPMSPFFEKIFSELVVLAYREGAFDKDHNLTMCCFILIDALIENSSHDKSEKLSEVLIYFLTQFEGTFNTVSDVILELQSYYCTIFRAVFKKMLKKINPEMGSKIYGLLENSFKLRRSVYEEAILAIGALASNMGEPFDHIMAKFQDYLLYALNSFTDSSLCKSALIALGHIVRATKLNFSQYSEKFVPVLITILTNEDVTRTNKTLAITTLGEICMSVSEAFLPHLEAVMSVLFSAATLATEKADDDDEETEDYLKDLRFELIEAFTCISFGLDDIGKKETFARYVPHIFSFFNTITGDSYSQRPDILRSMLAFVTDMANSYGKEINAILDKEFVKRLILKLRGFKQRRYESDISTQEEVLKLVMQL